MDSDLVHRQTVASAVKHMVLGVTGLGCEDALIHLLNYVWPNIFETSPHVINAVMEAIEGMRMALDPALVLNYCLQGLFHPARKVREVYWKIYNSLYIGSQDALVAAYPILDDVQNNVAGYVCESIAGGSVRRGRWSPAVYVTDFVSRKVYLLGE
ncbi:hypothetical protein MLD38_026931 [Melastoma candidum]|uniref:Uncharacterized protein n=1 Tax=Melastoma candidum TaxID=119954 RepID=A0ACB9P1P0_9MYRT|nr:hypothetical protein MLD38_026931 [Melastoma candidum]